MKKNGLKQSIEIEEHVSILIEPFSEYLGHVCPSKGDTKTIFRSKIDLFHDQNISLTSIVGLGCDRTAVNTGQHNGVIRRF